MTINSLLDFSTMEEESNANIKYKSTYSGACVVYVDVDLKV